MKTQLIVSTLLATSLYACGAPSDDLSLAQVKSNAPTVCSIQAFDGHYLTAVGSGGRVTDVIHTNASRVGAWEKFTLVDLDAGTPLITYGIKAADGHFLTAVGGGGRITDTIHTNATQAQGWEKFTLIPLGLEKYAIQTATGNYLTAVNSGGLDGRFGDTMHTDATRISTWETFTIRCGL